MAESANRAGYNFYSIDFFGDVDQKLICKNFSLNHDFNVDLTIDNLLDNVSNLDFTHAIYGSGFENSPKIVSKLEKDCQIIGNNVKTLTQVRNWKYFFKTLKKLDISYPKSEIIPIEEAKEIINSDDKFIIKPIKSGGGHSIFDKESNEKNDLEGDVILQEFIEGRPISSLSLGSKNNSFFVGATKQLVGIPGNKFRYIGNVAPLNVPADVIENIQNISKKISDKFNLLGCNGVDFILKKSEPYVTEVNPRIVGSIDVVEPAYNINLIDLHVKICLGELDETEFNVEQSRQFFGKKVLFASNDFNYTIKKQQPFLRDIPHFNERIKGGEPICTIMGCGETSEKCCADLHQKEILIRNELIKK
jgi:methenyltetrahydromethanopterin cyclohydrolase|tara:strand:+ start:2129 stop:3214 length:1086 start_codon:yes stop_codon:yes gene_type:complete